MSNRKPLTDDGILTEKKVGAHRRQKWFDNTVNVLMIVFVTLVGLLAMCAFVRAGLIYIDYMTDPSSVDIKSINLIETLATHVSAGVGGYVLHVMRRATGVKD